VFIVEKIFVLNELDKNSIVIRNTKFAIIAPFTIRSIFGTVPLFGSWTN
jgi:hypothetical protein